MDKGIPSREQKQGNPPRHPPLPGQDRDFSIPVWKNFVIAMDQWLFFQFFPFYNQNVLWLSCPCYNLYIRCEWVYVHVWKGRSGRQTTYIFLGYKSLDHEKTFLYLRETCIIQDSGLFAGCSYWEGLWLLSLREKVGVFLVWERRVERIFDEQKGELCRVCLAFYQTHFLFFLGIQWDQMQTELWPQIHTLKPWPPKWLHIEIGSLGGN